MNALTGAERIRCVMRTSLRSTVYVLGIVVLTSVAVGCSNRGSADNGSSATSDPSAVQSVSTSAPDPLAEANVDRKTRRPDPDATAITLTNIAVTRQDDHDQVVLSFTGSATPGWAVQYVDTPIQNGTTDPLKLPGQSRLEVLVLETPSPFSNPAGYTGPPVVFDNDTPQINTVQFASQASGITQLFVTLNGVKPKFNVSSLADPTRIVIDVAN
jgi:hypothetical protein